MRKLATLTAIFAVALTTGAQARPDRIHTARLHIGPTPVAWQSPQRQPSSVPFVLQSVRVDGHAISFSDQNASECYGRMYGRGAVVAFNTCGRGRVTMRIRALALKPVTLTVRYTTPKF